MKTIGTEKVLTSANSADITVNATATVYTHSFYIAMADFFAVSYTAASTLGGINLKIELEQSFQPPTTEGSSDTYWAEPTNMADVVAALTVESTIYHQSLAPVPLKYGRFKITGGAGNSTDTVLNMWISRQENF